MTPNSPLNHQPHRIRPTAREWLAINASIGALSLGGAARTLMYQDHIVHKKKWMTADEFQEALTITAVLPGANLVNLCLYLGDFLTTRTANYLGLIALTLPGSFAAILVVIAINLENPHIARLFQGFSIGSVTLFIVYCYRLFIAMQFDLNLRVDPASSIQNSITPILPSLPKKYFALTTHRLRFLIRILIGCGFIAGSLYGVSLPTLIFFGIPACLILEFVFR